MADNKGEAPIIVKKIKKVSGGGHHGGAWKIAYADFVTAMMAFFLLMWLLGSTTKGDLQGISDYFNTPLKVAMAGGSGSGDSSSVIQGGGKDLSRSNGQVKNSNVPKTRKTINFQAAKAELERKEKEMLEGLKIKIESLIDSSIKIQQFKDQIRMDITNEGLRIQIVDEQNRAMFDSGKAAMKDYTREILKEIARALNDVDNRIAISGHTDSAPFSSGERGYSNWELSADRANACRREMVAAGLADNKIIRVLGLASSVPFKKDDPLDASNRRISIIVMNKRAEETILNDGVPVEVSTPGDAGESIQMMDVPGNETNSAPPAVPSKH